MNSLNAREKSNKIGELLNNLSMFFLCMLFEYCMVHVTVSLSNVPKYFYFYFGASAFIGIILLIRKTNIFKWYIIAPLVLFWGNVLFFYFIHRHEYGYQYIAMLMAKYLMFSLFAIVVVNLIPQGVKSNLNKKHIGLFIVFFVAVVVTIILGHNYVLPIVCPIGALYLTVINSSTWKKLLQQFSLSMYIVVYLYTLASFVIKPNEYVAGRYWGIFNFPVVGATLAALGIISGIYLWLQYSNKFKSLLGKISVLVIAMIYPIYILIITLDRAVIAGLLSSLIFASIFCFGKKINYKKRGFAAIIAFFLLLIAFFSCSAIIYKSDSQTLDRLSNIFNKSSLSLINNILDFANRFKTGSDCSYFEQGTFLNAIDYFTSYRLGLWYLAYKEIRLLGGSPITFVISDIEYHTHNTYVEWFLRVGWIGGIFLTAWVFYYLVIAVRHRIQKDSLSLWSFIWISFCVVFMMVERELWIEFPMVLLLIFQYPLLFNIDKQDKYDY